MCVRLYLLHYELLLWGLRVWFVTLGHDVLPDPPELVHDADDGAEHTGVQWQGPESQRSNEQGSLSWIPLTKMMKFQVWTWILERFGIFIKNIFFVSHLVTNWLPIQN